jgi:hypothetical protein
MIHSVLALAGLWVVNLTISILNAVNVGKAWVEAKHAGGLPRFMAWCVAIMAAVGFTWCISIVLGLAAYELHWLDDQYMALFFESTYILLVPFLLSTGLAITIQSWARAYRGSICQKGVAVYNTFATVFNTYHAASTFGRAFGNVLGTFGKAFSSVREPRARAAMVVLALLLISLGSGTLITWLIIRRYAAAGERMPLQVEHA